MCYSIVSICVIVYVSIYSKYMCYSICKYMGYSICKYMRYSISWYKCKYMRYSTCKYMGYSISVSTSVSVNSTLHNTLNIRIIVQ